MIKKEDRSWALELPTIKDIFVTRFKNLFKEKTNATNYSDLEDCIERNINLDHTIRLGEKVTMEKTENTMFSLANNKA